MKISAPEYPQFLAALKVTIRERQYQALRAVNHELLALYLEIGEAIYRKQEELGWGKAVVETLAHDLQTEFLGRNGFSARNLSNMKGLYFNYREFPKLQPLVAEISWAKNLIILVRCKDPLQPKADGFWTLVNEAFCGSKIVSGSALALGRTAVPSRGNWKNGSRKPVESHHIGRGARPTAPEASAILRRIPQRSNNLI